MKQFKTVASDHLDSDSQTIINACLVHFLVRPTKPKNGKRIPVTRSKTKKNGRLLRTFIMDDNGLYPLRYTVLVQICHQNDRFRDIKCQRNMSRWAMNSVAAWGGLSKRDRSERKLRAFQCVLTTERVVQGANPQEANQPWMQCRALNHKSSHE